MWLDRTIWVIWIWAEIWMLLCDLTFWVLFAIYSVLTCDRSHVHTFSVSYSLRTWPMPYELEFSIVSFLVCLASPTSCPTLAAET